MQFNLTGLFWSTCDAGHGLVISNRWNKDLLVEEALKLMLNGQIEFGYANQPISQVGLTSG